MTTLSRSRRTTSPAAAWQAFAVIILGAIVVAVLATTSDAPADTSVRDAVPEGFPVPSGAELINKGDSVTLSVPGSLEDVKAFYSESLPPAGWEVTDTWKGTDPNNFPTTGLVIAGNDKPGAIAFTEGADDGRVLVRLNLTQPRHKTQMDGMGP